MTKDKAIELLDCLLGMVDDNQGNDYDEAFHMAIDALKEQPEPQWIPCSERLPEENGAYLVNVSPYYLPPESGQIDLLIFVDGKWMFWDVTEAKEFPEPIIAWMPLPEPYKERMEE